MLQKGGSFKGRIAAREVAMDELWGIIYVFFFILTGLHFCLYERKERVVIFIVGDPFLNQDNRKRRYTSFY